MSAKRRIEVFSAGCPACNEAIESIQALACDSCETTVLDMHRPDVIERARQLGIRSIPAVVIDGKLAQCCAGRGPDRDTLRRAGLGQPLA